MRRFVAAMLSGSVAVFVLIAASVRGAVDSDIDLAARGVLTRYLRFGAIELAALAHGKVVKHSIDTSAPGEIAVAGAVRVEAPKARLLERVRDIVHFKRGPEIIQIGRFSAPPVFEDLTGLTVDREDFDPASCHVRDCDVRLPADAIQRLEREFDTRAADAQARAATWFKQVLLADSKAYVSGDSTRIVQYDDGEKPIRPADEFAGILKNAPALAALAPGLPAHLADFPANRVEGAEDFLYWSKEKFGVGPFITLTHVTIVCPSDHTCVIATKDVYSSRYIDASLAITIATDAIGTRDAFYLVYANWSRANALKGRLSALKRSIADRRARSSLDTSLKTLKTQLEKGPGKDYSRASATTSEGGPQW